MIIALPIFKNFITFSFNVTSKIQIERILETFELEQHVHEFDGTLSHTKTVFGKHYFDFATTDPLSIFLLGKMIQELITEQES